MTAAPRFDVYTSHDRITAAGRSIRRPLTTAPLRNSYAGQCIFVRRCGAVCARVRAAIRGAASATAGIARVTGDLASAASRQTGDRRGAETPPPPLSTAPVHNTHAAITGRRAINSAAAAVSKAK